MVAAIQHAAFAVLYKMTGISYSDDMSLAESPRTEPRPDAIRAARAAFVSAALKQDRWSVRQTAVAIGMSHSALSKRVNGETSFFAEDIEMIAQHLRRDPVEFYAAYLASGTKKGPASEEAGPVKLPDVDSNHEPAVTSLAAYRRGKEQTPTTERGSIAPVTSIRANA